MDLKYFHEKLVLHLVDHATRLLSSALFFSKIQKLLLKLLFLPMVYPAAEKLMLDNDAMFNSQMEKSEE